MQSRNLLVKVAYITLKSSTDNALGRKKNEIQSTYISVNTNLPIIDNILGVEDKSKTYDRDFLRHRVISHFPVEVYNLGKIILKI